MTDAKSLVDHLQKTFSVSAERQTMINLLVIKDLVGKLVVQMKVGTNYPYAASHLGMHD